MYFIARNGLLGPKSLQKNMKGKLPARDQTDLFRSRLYSIIMPKHELCQLARETDWDWLDEEFDPYYAKDGRPSIPVRTMVGMLLLKQLYNESDESVIARWMIGNILLARSIFSTSLRLIQRTLSTFESGWENRGWRKF